MEITSSGRRHPRSLADRMGEQQLNRLVCVSVSLLFFFLKLIIMIDYITITLKLRLMIL